jgi:hypothetical protein
MIIKIGKRKIIINNIESYLYHEKNDYTEIVMNSGFIVKAQKDITITIEQLLSEQVNHTYKEYTNNDE